MNSVVPRALLYRQRLLLPRFGSHPFTNLNVIKQCLWSTVGFFGGFDTLVFFLICLSQWTFLLWYHFFHKHFPFAPISKQRVSFPGSSVVKNILAKVGDTGSIPGLRRSPGEGNGNPLQYSCWKNPMDRGAWQAIVHGVAKEPDTTKWLNNKKQIRGSRNCRHLGVGGGGWVCMWWA